MNQVVSSYLSDITKTLQSGQATEHTYRPALKSLFKKLTHLAVHNEPKGSAHGRPDFIFTKEKDIPVAWAEAKDLHINLDKVEKSEQMGRYFGYPNLILTNGLEFRFYKNGEAYGDPLVIGDKKGDEIQPNEKVFGTLADRFKDFTAAPVDSIRSAEHLAKIMGGKARRIRDNIGEMLSEGFTGKKGDIEDVMKVLQAKLIHDLDSKQFADLYAQTLVYGLFVARYNDDTPDTFTRAEARDRIPASNHLLQEFFNHIAGSNFVPKLSHIVDELCEVFVHADVKALVHGLYQQMNLKGETHDPIIHFYEDFLKEYDPKLRMQRGVYYTPLPVVRYIVRSVDAILKEHFGLRDGLADREQIDYEYKVQNQKKKAKMKIPKVQILDPAVGTGTFLNEAIHEIHRKFEGQEGMWPSFVEEHLVPRLNGFELMMASYTIAHLKLSMTLAETGITDLQKRLRIFLTNSLEEAPARDDTLFAGLGLDGALTEEGELAEEVKRDYPIMVVMGNPPYSASSQNASTEIGPDGKKRKTWIGKLLDDYKKDLNEKKINLDDDYIKFIRFAHYMIEKNRKGIVAMITNNSFLDGITHRRMRESLLETFDHIFVLDLHGDSNMQEVAPDGSEDKNVFDIQQGVGIALFVKTSKKKKGSFGKVQHVDLYGKRDKKYEWLENHDITNTDWVELETPKPNFFFVPKDLELQDEYETGLRLINLFNICGCGVKTERDRVSIHWSQKEAEQAVQDFRTLIPDKLKLKYNLQKDSRDWTIAGAIEDVQTHQDTNRFQKILYRPFDVRHTWYSGQTRGFIGTPGYPTMQHLLHKDNVGLLSSRQNARSGEMDQFFATKTIAEIKSAESTRQTTVIPLYLYPNSTEVAIAEQERTANLNIALLQPVLDELQFTWAEVGTGNGRDACGPEDIFDYIYSVLHSPSYRERYKEFLKIDFPRVPFTSDTKLFWALVKLGRELRLLHLLESPKLEKLITKFPVAGTNLVEKVKYDEDKKCVYINAEQYFEGIESEVWAFPIGGYQPLQKWLKDRKGRELTSDDILHWQKVVVALKETGRLMKEIDEEIAKNGGFPIK